MKTKIIFALTLYAVTIFPPLGGQKGACQTIGSDTTIQAFNMLPQINNLQDTTVAVVFPSAGYKYEKILMHYSLSKPAAGWDPWDRIGYVRVFTANDTFEIGRVMTPYSKACSWTIDVTDYRPLLTDTTKINSFILFWASNNKGYLVSISFDFIGGNPSKEAYKIQNLWGNDVFKRWEYGNDNIPIDSNFTTKSILTDPFADSVKVKVIATGHGQGNTGNAAEFSNKTHSVVINGNIISHQLWRSNCGQNLCSPQNGTWQYNRAGWCPGADVLPWDVDITSYITPGNLVNLGYKIQPYHNYCSPADSNCISGTTCADCNYNSNGHTTPWYLVQSQVVFYKNIYSDGQPKIANEKVQFFFYPNPAGGKFTIELPSLNFAFRPSIQISNVLGEIIFKSEILNLKSEINLSGYPEGIYFINIYNNGMVLSNKILIQ